MNKKHDALMGHYVPFSVPEKWTTKKDRREYDDTVGKPGDYYEDVSCRLEEACTSLNLIVEGGIKYFQKKIKHGVPVPVEAFAFGEKLQLLEEFVAASSNDFCYLSLFCELISYCHWVDAQRGRVLSTYYRLEKPRWVTPLLVMADYLTSAGMRLEEALVCEHEDYQESGEYH